MFGAKSIDIKSGSALNIDGSKVGIKAGGDMGLQAGCISLNGFAGGAAKQKAAIKSTKPDTTRNGKGFWEATATLQTTVDRVPTHEPFADHKTTTQESVLRSVQVGNIPTSGTVILDKLKQSVKTPSSGLSLIKALTNKESVSPASILKQLDVNINVEKLSSGVIKNLAAATVEKVGSGGLLSFVDPITKAVGKYGADTISLVNNGFVRPETFFNGELDNPRMWTNKLGIDGLQSFLGAGNIQEDIFLTDIVDDYQNAVLSGAIQDDDAEEDIAGMVMVTRATNAEVAGDFREGRTIDPKPIIGTVNIASADGMIKELTSWYQKGVSAASMVGTRDNLGYTNNWYDNNYQEELDNSW